MTTDTQRDIASTSESDQSIRRVESVLQEAIAFAFAFGRTFISVFLTPISFARSESRLNRYVGPYSLLVPVAFVVGGFARAGNGLDLTEIAKYWTLQSAFDVQRTSELATLLNRRLSNFSVTIAIASSLPLIANAVVTGHILGYLFENTAEGRRRWLRLIPYAFATQWLAIYLEVLAASDLGFAIGDDTVRSGFLLLSLYIFMNPIFVFLAGRRDRTKDGGPWFVRLPTGLIFVGICLCLIVSNLYAGTLPHTIGRLLSSDDLIVADTGLPARCVAKGDRLRCDLLVMLTNQSEVECTISPATTTISILPNFFSPETAIEVFFSPAHNPPSASSTIPPSATRSVSITLDIPAATARRLYWQDEELYARVGIRFVVSSDRPGQDRTSNRAYISLAYATASFPW